MTDLYENHLSGGPECTIDWPRPQLRSGQGRGSPHLDIQATTPPLRVCMSEVETVELRTKPTFVTAHKIDSEEGQNFIRGHRDVEVLEAWPSLSGPIPMYQVTIVDVEILKHCPSGSDQPVTYGSTASRRETIVSHDCWLIEDAHGGVHPIPEADLLQTYVPSECPYRARQYAQGDPYWCLQVDRDRFVTCPNPVQCIQQAGCFGAAR